MRRLCLVATLALGLGMAVSAPARAGDAPDSRSLPGENAPPAVPEPGAALLFLVGALVLRQAGRRHPDA